MATHELETSNQYRSARDSGRRRWLPGIETLRRYEVSWLRHDLVAGLVMTTMLVPVGIAYAEASGIPGINGLYATIVPLLAYALFGPSRILILGQDFLARGCDSGGRASVVERRSASSTQSATWRRHWSLSVNKY
jgi:MFS superfamily sulfate permease-like transporter